MCLSLKSMRGVGGDGGGGWRGGGGDTGMVTVHICQDRLYVVNRKPCLP